MHRFLSVFLLIIFTAALCCCAGNPFPTPVQVTVTNAISSIQIGEAPVTLTAVVAHDRHNAGVTWALTLAGVSCSPSCGTLVPSAPPSLTAVYTPPSVAPLNQSATITVVSVAEKSQFFVFNFSIVPAVGVTITNKFTTITAGSGGTGNWSGQWAGNACSGSYGGTGGVVGNPTIAINTTIANTLQVNVTMAVANAGNSVTGQILKAALF